MLNELLKCLSMDSLVLRVDCAYHRVLIPEGVARPPAACEGTVQPSAPAVSAALRLCDNADVLKCPRVPPLSGIVQ